MAFESRPYQNECVESIITNWKQGIHQQLIAMSTGTGKAVIIARAIKEVWPLLTPVGKVLVFAHREELVDQLKATIERMNPGLKVGKEMAGDYADETCDVVVSCVASIGRAGATRLDRFGYFSLVVCDEAHHSIASTYCNVFAVTGVLNPDAKNVLLGFTATPKRRNLKRKEKKEGLTYEEESIIALKNIYKKVVYSYPIRQAIKDGWLVPIRGYRVKTDTSLDNVKITAGDFQQDDLSKTVNTATRNAQVVDAWLNYGEGRQTVGFTVDIAHAKALADEFKKHNVKAEAVWGNDPERAVKLAQHKQREITVLLNAQVLTEGYDDWQVACIIGAAPTQSPTKYPQEIGRGTRLQEGAGNLLDALNKGYALSKKDCIVIDMVDNYKNNTLSTLPSLFGLPPQFDLDGQSVIEAVEEMEQIQEQHPEISFSHVESVQAAKAYLESVDLFAAPEQNEEVEMYSRFTWMPTVDGSFMISIPEAPHLVDQKRFSQYKHERWIIKENELGEFEVILKDTSQERKVGEYTTLEYAFKEADSALMRYRTDRMKPLLRNAEWKSYPASKEARQYLAKLARNKKWYIDWCLCTGQAVGDLCSVCKKKKGVTAGQVSMAINKLKSKGTMS